MQFEKHTWQPCLQSYAVYKSHLHSTDYGREGRHLTRTSSADTIDPSIRYAAYQLKTPRTIPIPTIAHRGFSQIPTKYL